MLASAWRLACWCWRSGIVAFRSIYLNALPLGVLDHDAAASFYDTLVRFLRLGLRTVLVFGLVIALAGFLTGTLGYRGTSSCRAKARNRLAPRRC